MEPEYPDPGEKLGEFLGWLLKQHRGNLPLRECKRHCLRKYGPDFDVEDEVNRLGKKRLEYVSARGDTDKKFCLHVYPLRNGEKHVRIDRNDTEYVDSWATFYHSKRAHHCEHFKLSKK